MVGWVFRGQPWVDFPPDSLREGLVRLRERPTAPNKFSYKYSTPRRVFFEVGYDPDAARWILNASDEEGPERILPQLRDLLKGGQTGEAEE